MDVLSRHSSLGLSLHRRKGPFWGAYIFNLGKIKSDQLEAYTNARSEATDESRRWLAPVLESE